MAWSITSRNIPWAGSWNKHNFLPSQHQKTPGSPDATGVVLLACVCSPHQHFVACAGHEIPVSVEIINILDFYEVGLFDYLMVVF